MAGPRSSDSTSGQAFPAKLAPLFRPKRYKIGYGGRGGAKSWGFARALLIRGYESPTRVLCAREFQNSIKDSVLKLLADQVNDLGYGDFYDVQTNGIYGKNGTSFAFEGLRQNVSRIKSYEGVDIVWVEEAEKVSANSWNVLIPTIRKEGSEIWISMNPEFEDDPSYERFIAHPPRDSVVMNINWRDNPWFPEVLRQEKDDLKERDPDSHDHVWEGHCRQWVTGAIYAAELRKCYEQNRITKVEWDPALPVYTAWDLGHTDDTAIWWYQVVMGEIHLLECFSSNGAGLSVYAEQILGRKAQIDLIGDDVVCTLGEWNEELAHRRRYRYAMHWLPPDARAKTLASNGKSIIQQLSTALGLSNMGIVPDIGVEDGIQAARMVFGRCWFDLSGCDDGIKCLRRYQRGLKIDQRSRKKTPDHDWTSHVADAFRYMAVAVQNDVTKTIELPRTQWHVEGDPVNQARFILPSLETMWKQQAKPSARI